MMMPSQLGVIPLFMLMAKLELGEPPPGGDLADAGERLRGRLHAPVPRVGDPDELLEAAAIDGASTFRIFRSIVLPIARPAMAVLGMLTFLMAWNDFFWPIIALTSSNPTVQVALNSIGNGYVPDHSVIMAATLVGTVPVLIVFVLLGRQIVGGIMEGAVKG